MSDLNLSASIESLELPLDYEVKVALNLPEGTFAAIEESDLDPETGVRTMQVSLMKLHVPAEGSDAVAEADASLSPAGKMEINSGTFYRLEGENSVKVVVKENGEEVASTTLAFD